MSENERRRWRKALTYVAVASGVGLATLVLLFLFRPTINITLLKGPVEEILTELIESSVTVEKVTLRPGSWIELEIHDLRIESTGADVTVDFAHLERALARVELLPMFRREIRLDGLVVDGAELRLHRDRRNRGNWPVWTTFTWNITRLDALDVRVARVQYLEVASGREILAEIEHLTGGISLESPFHLEGDGSVEEVPFSLSATGGTLAEFDGADQWPIALALSSKSLLLNVAGNLPLGEGAEDGMSFDFAISDPDLAANPATASFGLPDLGAVSMKGTIKLVESSIELLNLEGSVGRSDFTGELRMLPGDERPLVTGRLAAKALDLAPWLEAEPAPEPESGAEEWEIGDLEDITFEGLGDALRVADFTLSVTAGSVLGLPLEVADLNLDVGLDDGDLDIPLAVRLAGSGLTGRAGLDASGETPSLSFEIGATSLVPEELLPLPSGHPLRGTRIEDLALEASSSGRTAAEHFRTLSIELDGRGMSTTLPWPEDEPWALRLDEALLSQAGDGPLRFSAAGSLAGEALALNLETENLSALAQGEVWPFALEAEGGGARADVTGSLAGTRGSAGLTAEIVVAGEKIGDLAPWMDLPAEAPYPYELRVGLDRAREDLTIRFDSASLGRTSVSGDLEINETPAGLFVSGTLRSPLIALDEVMHVLGTAAEPAGKENDLELILDRRLLPSAIDLGTGDLNIRIDEIVGPDWRFADIDLPLRLRDGRLERSPYSFSDGRATYDGALALDLRHDVPELHLELSVERAELERLLEEQEQDTGVGITARALQLDIEARGSTLGEVLSTGTALVTMDDAELDLASPEDPASPESNGATRAYFDKLTIRDTRDGPFVLEATGRIEDLPLDLRLEAETSLDLLKGGADVPMKVDASTDGAEVHFEGTVTLPLGTGGNDLELSLEADRLDRFSPLIGMDLPAIGPFSLSANWKGTPGGNRFGDLKVGIGRSEITGTIALNQGAVRPRLEVRTSGGRLVLEDLVPSPPPGGVELKKPGRAEASAGPDLFERLHQTLTPELLESLDIDMLLRIDELIWEERALGEAVLEAVLDSGRLTVDFTQTKPDRSPVRFDFELAFQDSAIETGLAVRLVKVDYSPLGELLDTAGELDGEFSADLDLRSVAPSFREILANLNGAVAFTDYPRETNATILDLWGGQIIRGLLPGIVGGEKPQFNCTVARFDVVDGRATPEMFFLDTTGSRITGKGWIDLGSGRLNLKLKPRPKQRGLINLSTTVRVGGYLSDPAIRFTAGGLAQTAFRLSLWVWTVWRELVLRKPLPTDGHDVCVDPPPMAFTDEAVSGGRSSPRP